MSRPCRCHSGRTFDACCGPYLSGAAAPATAEALMRSRYTAYVEGAVDYLLQTTAADKRAAIDRARLVDYCNGLRGLGLQILAAEHGGPDDETGTVTFEATLRLRGRKFVQRERSRFHREHGRWVYDSGDVA
jgi:SEC-C motif-containing protein